MHALLKENAHKNTGIGYLMFNEKQLAQRFDFFSKHEFRRIVDEKVS
jgi:hypothetical protein